MADVTRAGAVLPRPRIPLVLGILNIVIAAGLIILSLGMGGYTAVQPMTFRAMNQVQKQAEAELAARQQAELKAIEEAERTATTADERKALAERRKALEVRPKVALPMKMDFNKLGWEDPKFLVYPWVDATTALALDILLLMAGVGLVHRRMWGIRLGLWTAAAKIVRLVLVYGFVALVLVPPMAEGIGRMAGEMIAQQQAAGRPLPPTVDAAFITRMYFIFLTVMAVAMVLFGSIYPAISLWLLSRPGARAACEERAIRDPELTGARVVGILNLIFASVLIVFGLCLGAYITLLPIIGGAVTQVQKKAEADLARKQQAELKAIEEAEETATTEDEKQELAAERKAILDRPKVQVAASVDFSKMGFEDPKLRVYYWIDLASGLLLNVAMIAAGIGLVRHKRWGITLGIGTAVAKIVRLVLITGYFTLAVAPVFAQKNAEMVGRMMVQQRSMGQAEPPAIDVSPLVQVNTRMYVAIAVALLLLGSIYPAISLWVLTRPGVPSADVESKGSRDQELNATW